MFQIERHQDLRTVAVAAAATKSGPIDYRGAALGALLLPAEFNGETISFEGAEKSDGTFAAVHDKAGAAVSFVAAAGPRWYELPPALAGLPWIKLVTSVAAAADATALLALKS